MVNEDRKFDIRVLERNFVKGKITREEYEAHVANLEDLEADAMPMDTSFEKDVLEADE